MDITSFKCACKGGDGWWPGSASSDHCEACGHEPSP